MKKKSFARSYIMEYYILANQNNFEQGEEEEWKIAQKYPM
jgi:hypothetical protein